MQCIFLFKDARGRLPTAQELSRRGFVVSEAVLPAECAQPPARRPGLAAEPAMAYGPQGGPPGAGADEAADRGGA